MIEIILTCDKCGEQEIAGAYTQLSEVRAISNKLTGHWSSENIGTKRVLLCKKCTNAWKKVSKKVVEKEAEEFFKK